MLKFRLLLALAPLVLAACWGDNSYNYGGPPPGPTANFQFVHASPDAPDLSVVIDGQSWFDGLHYGEGTGELVIPAGSHTVSVQALTPAGPTTVIAASTVNFVQDTDYVIVAEGQYASIGTVVFSHPLSVVAPTSTRIQVVHAAPAVSAMAIFLTAPGADLSTSAPLGSGSLAFMGAVGPNDVPSGSYEIRMTPSGATAPVLFDSGTITLIGGTDLVISALQNVGPGTSPITLGIVAADGGNSKLYDLSAPADLRVVNASANAPPLSIFSSYNDLAMPLVPSLAFEGFTSYLALSPASYSFAITPASTTSQVLATQALTLNGGTEQTLYLFGPLASLTTDVTWDDRRRLATAAKLRIIDGSPSAGLVDIYVVAHGSGIASMAPTFSGVPFEGDTRFQQFAPGSYDLIVTPAGTQTVTLGPVNLNIIDTGVYTAVVRDAPGGGAPYGLILMDDFAP